MRVLVIGYGNPLCGDDGVSWRIVEALAGIMPNDSAVTLHQLTPEWAEPISAADHVIFVDAAIPITPSDRPGDVNCFPITAAPGQPGSHETTPEGILSMAAELFGRCPPAHMVTITGGSFEISESLTAVVAAAVPKATTRILALLEQVSELTPSMQL